MRKSRGSLRHLKRSPAPSFWQIMRKERVWTVKPMPGPHPIWRCIPLGILLRDYLKLAETMKEARRILGEGQIKVDGRVRRDYKYPTGLMDVVEIVTIEEFYRIVPHRQKFLWPLKIEPEEAKLKLCRIENKVTVKGGHIQLNLHDGRNILIRVSNPMAPEEDVYRTLDSVLIEIPDQNIVDHIKLDIGTMVVVIDGRNVGRLGKVKSITPVFKRKNYLVELEDPSGNKFSTVLKYIFPVGIDAPLITVSGEQV